MRYRLLIIVLLLQVVFYSCTESSGEAPEDTLELNKNELTIGVGEEEILTIVEAPSFNETLVWSSDNEDVASVFHGIVSAKSSGTATVTATYGNITANCIVTVPERTYQLVWSDEFDGTELNEDNWGYDIGNGNWGWGVGEKGYSTSRTENVRVENGLLTIEARKEEMGGMPYTTARIKTKGKKDFTYGKIEARLKVPSGVGTWPAFWMLGYGSWPAVGEIDIMEHVGYDPETFHCALHTLNKNGLNGKNFLAHQELDQNVADDFHIVTMEWVEKEFMGFDRIHIYIDGVKSGTFAETPQLQDSGDWPFGGDNKFFFILNLAIGGNWGGVNGIDDAIFDNPVLYQVDYVRVYQLL